MRKLNLEMLLILGGAVVGAALIAVLTWPRVRPLPERSVASVQAKSLLGVDPECTKASLAKLPAAEAKKQKYACAKAVEERRLALDDLVQQTRSADAAAQQADLAGQATWLAFVQAIGGFVTLVAAGAAAWYARHAAEIAARSYRAERKRAKQLDRPWICIDLQACSDLDTIGTTTKFRVNLQMHNTGAQVARNVLGWVEIFEGAGGVEKAKKDVEARIERIWNSRLEKNGGENLRTILPNRSSTVACTQEIQLKTKSSSVRAVAWVKYLLPSGETGTAWEVFEYCVAKPNQPLRAVTGADQKVPMAELTARSIGAMHVE